MNNRQTTENYHIPIFGNRNKNVLFSDHLPVEAKQDDIHVVSFNASFVLGDLVAFGNKEFASEKEFVRRVLKWMNSDPSYHPHNKFVDVIKKMKPDIICIQESPTTKTAKLITGLKKEGYHTKENISGPERILTCFSNNFELKDNLKDVNSDILKTGRPLQACVLKNGEKIVLVINLHSPNPAAPSNNNIFTNMRHKLLIQKGLDHVWSKVEHQEQITHVVLCGDFNDANHLYRNVKQLYESTFKIGDFTLSLNTSRLPKTCCSYALNKVTRLPGDYIMIASKNESTRTIITAFPENGLPNLHKNEFTSKERINGELMRNKQHYKYTNKYNKNLSDNLKRVLSTLKNQETKQIKAQLNQLMKQLKQLQQGIASVRRPFKNPFNTSSLRIQIKELENRLKVLESIK